MIKIRLSAQADIPALRELWRLAFGDDGAYVDNFFTTYYRPERMLVLEEGGALVCMTAWFDTTLVLPALGECRAAYLYAVATHPSCRGRGLAGQLLLGADEQFRAWGIQAVTTVPAEPSLHHFFGANGFAECFTHSQKRWQAAERGVAGQSGVAPALEPLQPREYGRLREQLLANVPHIAYPVDALTYQAGCCQISGGGLYGMATPAGPVVLCAEGLADGTLLLKELLGSAQAVRQGLACLDTALPPFGGHYRTPGDGTKFGMLKWLDAGQGTRWDWSGTAYLGLAFD